MGFIKPRKLEFHSGKIGKDQIQKRIVSVETISGNKAYNMFIKYIRGLKNHKTNSNCSTNLIQKIT